MKKLRLIRLRIAAMLLAVLMNLGLVACSKQPADPVNGETHTQQEDMQQDQAQADDQAQKDDEKGDTDQEELDDSWELPEDVFEDTPENIPDEKPSDEKPSDEKPADDETTNEGSYDGGAIVLPDDVWD